ncbi:MAG: relaxase domain-containing protein, partial [Actinomycetota bacterium]|nr:relaxase domain-containing protein [Actinomycetota bacterium]
DMTCIPEAVREVLSQRSAQVKAKHDELIRRWSAENDGAEPDRETIARLERSAAVTSRPSKQHGTDAMTLHDTWRTQARSAGLDPDRLTPTRLDRRPQLSGIGDPMLIAEALHHVAEESLTALTETPQGCSSKFLTLVVLGL